MAEVDPCARCDEVYERYIIYKRI